MRTPLTVCLLLVMAAAGCGSGKTEFVPVEFGTARPGGEKIAVAKAEVIPASQWPSACKLLTDGEITALLPQATKITRSPRPVKIISILQKDQNSTAAEGECSYKFWLKGASIEEATSSIIVSIRAMGDPALIKAHYEKHLADDRKRTDQARAEDHGDRLGAEACYGWVDSLSTLVCRQGPLMFEIRGMGSGAFAGVPSGLTAEAIHWRDKAQGPVAQLIAAKVP
ncbi:hypothetical protein [Actinoplanes sp. NPDC089786]|uniref:hypothetical protein n=1 Tax=Actinoplanes sp. NPDC089786 TaxID=3155185 RepID=UPI00341660D3